MEYREMQNSLGKFMPAKQIKENTAKYFISPDFFPLRLSIKYWIGLFIFSNCYASESRLRLKHNN